MAQWTEQKERSNSFTLKLICWIALNLSRRFARLLLWPITLYFFLSSSQVRFASHQYLRRVPGCSGNMREVFRHIHHFSAIVLDRVYFLTDQFHRFNISLLNEECIDTALKKGKGVILLGSHVGSFDASRCLAIDRENLPLKILMYQDHNAMITKIMDELNPKVASSIINLADSNALLQMKEAIDENYLIGMLGDRVLAGEKKVSCKLLGDEVLFPVGPFSLALMLGVPVVGFFGIYKGGNSYEIHHSLLYDGQQVERNQRVDIVARLTQEYVDSIGEMVKQYPYNWFNFYDYWDDKARIDKIVRDRE